MAKVKKKAAIDPNLNTQGVTGESTKQELKDQKDFVQDTTDLVQKVQGAEEPVNNEFTEVNNVDPVVPVDVPDPNRNTLELAGDSTKKELKNQELFNESTTDLVNGAQTGDLPDGSDQLSATVTPPAVVDKVEDPKLSSEDVVLNPDQTTPHELAQGMLADKKSMKFTVDPAEVKAQAYAVEDFREMHLKFRKKMKTSPDTLFANTLTLTKLGYRDIASELGLHIQEGTTYKETELVFALS